MRSTSTIFLSLFLVTINASASLAFLDMPTDVDLKLGRLAQELKDKEIMSFMEERIKGGSDTPTKELFFLCVSYFNLKMYDKMFQCALNADRRIAAGDSRFFGGDLTVTPCILRGRAYLELGNYDRAIRESENGLSLLHRNGLEKQSFYRSQLIDLLRILGTAHGLKGNRGESAKTVTALGNIDVRNSNLQPEKYVAIASVWMANRNFKDALRVIGSDEARVPTSLTRWYDTTFQDLPKAFILAKCLLETGRVQEAKERYDALLRHPRIEQLGDIYWLILLDRAIIEQREERSGEAITLLRKAIGVVEEQRSSISSEANKIGFVGDKQALYQLIVELLIKRNNAAEAFEYVEKSKSRALVDLLSSQKQNVLASASPRARSLVDELEKSQGELATPGSSDAEFNRQRGIVLKLKRDFTTAEPEIASLVTVVSQSTGEIQRLLRPDENLVEYYSTPTMFFAFVLTGKEIRAVTLPKTSIEEGVLKFRNALTDTASVEHKRLAASLHHLLFHSIERHITAKNLIIVPHGILHYLPFSALSDGHGYLIDTYALRVLPSASVLNYLQGRKHDSRRSILIVGNPDLGNPRLDLKFAGIEAAAIAGEMPGARLLLREKATKTAVETMMGGFSILHFATHGIFNPDKPLGSALLLAGDGEQDGFLTVSELYNLRLHADLVTLSACETALAKVANGDDLIGFTRALLYAGSSSIVSSLWNVDDQATGDLMLEFYRNLRKSGNKMESLIAAQRTIKKLYHHPYYWAAFQLTGSAM